MGDGVVLHPAAGVYEAGIEVQVLGGGLLDEKGRDRQVLAAQDVDDQVVWEPSVVNRDVDGLVVGWAEVPEGPGWRRRLGRRPGRRGRMVDRGAGRGGGPAPALFPPTRPPMVTASFSPSHPAVTPTTAAPTAPTPRPRAWRRLSSRRSPTGVGLPARATLPWFLSSEPVGPPLPDTSTLRSPLSAGSEVPASLVDH